jgi:hypothetical protein
MGCGCSNQAGSANGGEVIEPIGPTFILPEETIECYMARSPGDPAPTEPEQENKIATLTIPVDCEMKVDTTFKMTPDSETPDEWKLEIKDNQGNVVTPDSIGLTYDSGTPKLSGTIKDEFEKKGFVANMKANKGGETLDEKTYKFIGKKCTQGDLRLINPNPTGVFTSKFGPRKSPVPGASTNHKGLDIATGGKADILAAADGIVTEARYIGKYGNVIYIRHTDASGKILAETRYAHLARMYVDKNDHVSAGQAIGKEGNTGLDGMKPHLHFEVRLGGSIPDDPMKYINGQVIAGNNLTKADPGDTSGPTTVIKQEKKAITREEVEYKQGCQPVNIVAPDPTYKKTGGVNPNSDKAGLSPVAAKCAPPDRPKRLTNSQAIAKKHEISAAVDKTLAKHPELGNEHRQYLYGVIQSESTYDNYAVNPDSSATGLYQMTNTTADRYFKKMGINNPTCEQRCDPELATEAQILMMKDEEKAYTSYKANGTINGKQVRNNAYTKDYDSLSKSEFMYLVHGVGERGAQEGRSNQFVPHFRKNAKGV